MVGTRHERAVEQLRDRIHQHGPQRLILGLEIGMDAAEVNLYGPNGPELYRQEAIEAQIGFMARMTQYQISDDFHDFRPVNGIPFVVMRLDEGGLDAAMVDEQVISINTISGGVPTLNVSAPFIGAGTAHSMGHTGSGQVVAVIDTGVDRSHPMFSGKVVSEACYSQAGLSFYGTMCRAGTWGSFVTNSGGACTREPGCHPGHGSHVAGIASGASVNPPGSPPAMAGVAYQSSVISAMSFTRIENDAVLCQGFVTNDCDLFLEDDVLESLMRIYDLRGTYNIASVNLSFVFSRISGEYSAATCNVDWGAATTAVNLLHAAGIAVVAGSGNRGQEAGFGDKIAAPACIANVVSVASTARGSNNFQSYANAAPVLDMLAPGGASTQDNTGSICSYPYLFPDSIWSAYYETACADRYIQLWGTSMATPHVAAGNALLRSRYPGSSWTGRRDWLLQSGVNVTFNQAGSSCSPGPGCYTKPRINLASAMSAPSAPGSAPGSASVTWQNCYGMNSASWSAASAPVTEYQLQGSISPTFSPAWTFYTGGFTGTGVMVDQDTYLRVRACNMVSCSAWTYVGIAQYHPYCL